MIWLWFHPDDYVHAAGATSSLSERKEPEPVNQGKSRESGGVKRFLEECLCDEAEDLLSAESGE